MESQLNCRKYVTSFDSGSIINFLTFFAQIQVCAPSASRLRSRNEMLSNSVDGSNSKAVSMDIISSPLSTYII